MLHATLSIYIYIYVYIYIYIIHIYNIISLSLSLSLYIYICIYKYIRRPLQSVERVSSSTINQPIIIYSDIREQSLHPATTQQRPTRSRQPGNLGSKAAAQGPWGLMPPAAKARCCKSNQLSSYKGPQVAATGCHRPPDLQTGLPPPMPPWALKLMLCP